MNSSLPPPCHHPACLNPEQLLADCVLRTSRHSGPGGQHRNKVETAVELIHQPTGITGFAAETRSQDSNRQMALFRLRLQLAIHLRTTASAQVYPSALWQKRCQKQRRRRQGNYRNRPGITSWWRCRTSRRSLTAGWSRRIQQSILNRCWQQSFS